MGLTRQEMFSRLQLIRLMEPLAGEALETRQMMQWKGQLGRDDDSPHGRPWHTSFHASSFPGTNPRACPRKAMYTLMDIPKDEPFSAKGILMMEMGKTVEQFYVEGFYYEGILLSPPPWEEEGVQMGFADPDTWLTGNSDAIILHPKLGRPHVWECKMRYADVIERMKVGLEGPDPAHVIQAKTYVVYMHELSKQLWPQYEPLRDGTIFYCSRDNPRETAEFFVEYDPAFKEAGRLKLKKWKEWFEDEILPTQALVEFQDVGKKPIKRHPLGRGWKWTELPCCWCDFKKTCKADHEAGTESLDESKAIEIAEQVRGEYNYGAVREAVFSAWADIENES